MNVRSAVALGGLTFAGLVAVAGPAAAVCDAYSGTCTEPPAVLDQEFTPAAETPTTTTTTTTQTRASVTPPAETPATLPFTGGELVLVSAVGIGALAGGTALVVAGRRRAELPTA